MQVALITNSVQTMSPAVREVQKACNRTKSELHLVLYDDAVRFDTSALDSVNLSDVLIVDMCGKLQEHKNQLLYHISVRESAKLFCNILLLHFVPGKSSASLVSSLKKNVRIIPYLITKYETLVSLDPSVLYNDVLQDESFISNSCLQRQPLSDEIVDALKVSKGCSRAPIQSKFLTDLRRARADHRGDDLRQELRSLRRRLKDPQLMSPDIVFNMLLAYRDCEDYSSMIQLVEAIRQPDVMPPTVDMSTFTYLYAFALTRRGDPGDQELALKEITEVTKAGKSCSADMYGLFGRIYKDRFAKSPNYSDKESLRLAIEGYRSGYQASASYYLGINLATLLACEDPYSISVDNICAALNCSIGSLGDISQLTDYWDLATLFELRMLEKKYTGAVRIIEQMFQLDTPEWQLLSTAQNIKLICHFTQIHREKQGHSEMPRRIPKDLNFWLEFLFSVQEETDRAVMIGDDAATSVEDYKTTFYVLIKESQETQWKQACLNIGVDPRRRLMITFCDQNESATVPIGNSPIEPTSDSSSNILNIVDLNVENITGISIAHHTVGQVYLFTVFDRYNYILKFSCGALRSKFRKVVLEHLLYPDQKALLTMANAAPTCLKFEYSGVKLGSGAFGTVHAGIECGSGRPIAIKEIRLRDPSQQHQMIEEIRLHARLEHVNIVRYLGAVFEGHTLKILMELVTGGSLKFVVNACRKLDEKTVADYSSQILEGLHYLHQKRIVHRDIKPDNILVDKYEPLLKISDFGLSKLLMGFERTTTSVLGTHCFMAPEVLNNKVGYDFSVDIWSFGCTVVYMLTGRQLYPELEPYQVIYQVGSRGQHPNIPDDVSPECRNFLMRTFAFNPKERASADDLRVDPFVDPYGSRRRMLRRSAASYTDMAPRSTGAVPFSRFVSEGPPKVTRSTHTEPDQESDQSRHRTSVPGNLNAGNIPPSRQMPNPAPKLNLAATKLVDRPASSLGVITPEPPLCTPDPFRIIRQEAESKRLLCEALEASKDTIVRSWHKLLSKSGARLPLSIPASVSAPSEDNNAELNNSLDSASTPLHQTMEMELLDCLYRTVLDDLRGGSLCSTLCRFVTQSFDSDLPAPFGPFGENTENGLIVEFCTIIKKLQQYGYRDDVALYPSSWLFIYLYSALSKLWSAAESTLCEALRGPHAVLAWFQFIQDAVFRAGDQLKLADQYLNLDATRAQNRTNGKRSRVHRTRAERRTIQLGNRKSTIGPHLSLAETEAASKRMRPISLVGQSTAPFRAASKSIVEEEISENTENTINVSATLPNLRKSNDTRLSSTVSSDVESDTGVSSALRESSALKVKFARLVSEYNELFRIAICQKEMDIEELRHVVPEFTCYSLEATTGFPTVREWFESLKIEQDDLETLLENVTDESDFLAMCTKEDLYRMKLHYSTILRVWRAVVSIRDAAKLSKDLTA